MEKRIYDPKEDPEFQEPFARANFFDKEMLDKRIDDIKSREEAYQGAQPEIKKAETYKDILERAFMRPISEVELQMFEFRLEHNLCYICGKRAVSTNGVFCICKQHEKEVKNHPNFRQPEKPKLLSEKYGRNAPCHCGSGKKYKNCCLHYIETYRKNHV